MNIPLALSGTTPVMDLNPRPVSFEEKSEDKAEAFIGRYGCQDFPYSLFVESRAGNVAIGTYKTLPEAFAAIPDGVTTCHWFITGKGKG